MKKGAEILVRNCARVRPGEKVTVVTDEERLPIARAVESAAVEAGGAVSVVICPERKIDNEEPAPEVAAARSLPTGRPNRCAARSPFCLPRLYTPVISRPAASSARASPVPTAPAPTMATRGSGSGTLLRCDCVPTDDDDVCVRGGQR